jgi:hypothetical protein
MGCGESPIVTRALAQSFVKLSIQEFIEVSGFKIDAIMLNYFWQFQTDLGWTHFGWTLGYPYRLSLQIWSDKFGRVNRVTLF